MTTPTASRPVRVVAVAASSSRHSINGQLIAHAADLLKGRGHEVEILDLNDFEMPIYSIDREQTDGVPDRGRAFFDAIGSADAVLVSFAEHNGSYTAAWKNVYDWASRVESKVWQERPTVMLSASPGAGGGGAVLQTATTAAPFQGADLVGSMRVPHFATSFDGEVGRLVDPELADELAELLDALVARATHPASVAA